MTRYFSDLDDGKTKYVDMIGTELADVELVSEEALGFLSIVFKDDHSDGDRVIAVSVRDEAGHVVYRSTLTLQTVWFDKRPSGRAAERSSSSLNEMPD